MSVGLRLLVLVALVGCGDVTSSGTRTSPSPSVSAIAPACPESLDARALKPVVPAPPSAAGSEGRLVPEDAPQSVRICRYTGVQNAPSTFDGGRDLRDVEQIAADLQLPAPVDGETQACTLIGAVHVPYLVRLQYPTGTVWVSTYSDPNGCMDTGNGVFTSKVYVGDDVAASYDAGRWTHAPSRSGNPCFGRVGRAGQERALLPPDAARIRVCQDQVELTPVTDRSTIVQITKLLNAVETGPSHGGCEGETRRARQLLVEYPTGRGVTLHVLDGCRPNAFTSSLSAELAPGDMDELFRLLG